jgi:hypothetical protein
MTILESLQLTEDQHTNMVLDEGKIYANAMGIPADYSFWNEWWRQWKLADEAELCIRVENGLPRGGLQGYLIVQRKMMYALLNCGL